MSDKNEFGQILGAPVENWTPRGFPPKKILVGRYCILEPLDFDKHSAALFAAISKDNPGDSWTYLPYGPFPHLADFQRWMKELIATSDVSVYALCDGTTKQPLGICGYLNINPQDGVIEVGHLHYSKQLQQTPATTEAMYLLMAQAFETLKYRRYEWKCHSLNEASRNAALRLGFQFEGTFRQHRVAKNHNRDTMWFSILDSEWPAIRKKLERWLDPANFDAQGKQMARLQDL